MSVINRTIALLRKLDLQEANEVRFELEQLRMTSLHKEPLHQLRLHVISNAKNSAAIACKAIEELDNTDKHLEFMQLLNTLE
jgi:trehalose/maltose hydrolase-like predicted phosphorylase